MRPAFIDGLKSGSSPTAVPARQVPRSVESARCAAGTPCEELNRRRKFREDGAGFLCGAGLQAR
jgi:hypothetical protein